MSRAFVKETNDGFESLPERPVSKHTNLVTREGLEQIEAAVARLRQERAMAQAAKDRPMQARIERDLRYWTSRHASAEVVHSAKDTTVGHFGCMVTIARDNGRQQSYRIVGEDEADPGQGTVSYMSPLGQALLGKQVGDVVRMGNSEAEILEIKPSR